MMRHLFLRAAAVVCVALLIVLALPTPTGAGKPRAGRAPATRADKAICNSQAKPRSRAAVETVHSRTSRGSVRRPAISRHRAQRRADRDAVFLRRWLLARSPDFMREPRLRLLDGWQIRLIDGDTFAYGSERVRIRGINAPEVSESGGFEASQRLDLLLREGPVTIIPQALDVYGRTVADVYVNNQNVAEVLKDEGYAKSR